MSARRFSLAAARRFSRRYASTPFDATGAAVDALRGELATTCDEVLGAGKKLNWVFLGAPGVGKGTYASRMAKQMGVPHISMGDLVRAEIKGETALGKELKAITARGAARRRDALVLDILDARIKRGEKKGERGFLLDGFPRTVPQAQTLGKMVEVTQVLNLTPRGHFGGKVLADAEKCGEKSRKAFNIADIRSEKAERRPSSCHR